YIYPSGSSYDLSNMKVQIVNQDTGYMNTDVSGYFTSALDQINSASLKMQFSNGTTVAGLTDSIQRGDIDAGIILPENFTYSVLTNQQTNITIISDNSNPQVSQAVSGSLSGIIKAMSTQVAQSKLAQNFNITNTEFY